MFATKSQRRLTALIKFDVSLDENGIISAGVNRNVKGKLMLEQEEQKEKIDNLVEQIKDRSNNENERKDVLQELGIRLYDLLIPRAPYTGLHESIRDEFVPFLQQVKKGQDKMRITLKIDNDYAQILPWELMHDGENYLGPERKISIVRLPGNIASQPRPKKVKDKLKVLVLVCTPRGTPKLEYAKEELKQISQIFRSVLGEEKVELQVLSTDKEDSKESATLDNIADRLDGNKFNIVHYIGHSEPGIIHLSDSEGEVLRTDSKTFAARFDSERTKNMALVILNSCESGSEKGFASLAKALVGKNIPCVVATQFKILDAYAPDFASEFYKKFLKDFSPEPAVNSCREKLQIWLGSQNREFAAPVLYLASIENSILAGRTVSKPPISSRNTRETSKVNSSTSAVTPSLTKQIESVIKAYEYKFKSPINRNEQLSINEMWRGNDVGIKPVLLEIERNAINLGINEWNKTTAVELAAVIDTKLDSLESYTITSEQKSILKIQILKHFSEAIVLLKAILHGGERDGF